MFLNSQANALKAMFMSKKFLLILFVAAILIAVATYVYMNHIVPKLQPDFVPNKEFITKDDDKITDATLYYFCAKWCPYCKKATPIIKKLRKKYETQKINGTTVTFETINSDKEESKVSEFEQEYKVQIKGFPTIYLVKGNQVIEFDTEPTENTLTEFLNTAL